jgi:hypothetical protein
LQATGRLGLTGLMRPFKQLKVRPRGSGGSCHEVTSHVYDPKVFVRSPQAKNMLQGGPLFRARTKSSFTSECYAVRPHQANVLL